MKIYPSLPLSLPHRAIGDKRAMWNTPTIAVMYCNYKR